MVNEGDKETVAWFSAGVSSFVAAYLAKPDRIVFINVASQHPDTLRFVADAERVLGRPIEIIGDQRYRQSVDEVIAKRRYINGPAGACCTTELKKRVRQEWERQNAHTGMVYVWGYDADERRRASRTAAASEFGVSFPLIERGLTKENCHAIAAELGIKRPAMYELGYSNNNCIGCVKGGARVLEQDPPRLPRGVRAQSQAGEGGRQELHQGSVPGRARPDLREHGPGGHARMFV